MSNMRQAQAAVALYTDDYTDMMMPVNHLPGMSATSQHDRTWVQLILPYLKNFSVFKCPGDYSDRPSPESTFDQDLVPGDTDSRYYSASMRSNIGFNYAYLSPVYRPLGQDWKSDPKSTISVTDSSRTILFVDSVWSVDKLGRPHGGGSWLVVPPCRYLAVEGQATPKDTFGLASGDTFFTPLNVGGWKSGGRNSADNFGFAWPWHNGRMNVIHMDGHSENVQPTILPGSCEVLPKWAGLIKDVNNYDWDLN
jgi:prepilin-type processing-associated H-X9-DG protein